MVLQNLAGFFCNSQILVNFFGAFRSSWVDISTEYYPLSTFQKLTFCKTVDIAWFCLFVIDWLIDWLIYWVLSHYSEREGGRYPNKVVFEKLISWDWQRLWTKEVHTANNGLILGPGCSHSWEWDKDVHTAEIEAKKFTSLRLGLEKVHWGY